MANKCIERYSKLLVFGSAFGLEESQSTVSQKEKYERVHTNQNEILPHIHKNDYQRYKK